MYGYWCFDDPAGNCNRSGAFGRHGEGPHDGFAEINHVLYSDDHGTSSYRRHCQRTATCFLLGWMREKDMMREEREAMRDER